MPFTKKECTRLIKYFSKGKLNEFSLVIVQKAFENLTPEENKNWFDKMLVLYEKTIQDNSKKFDEAKVESTKEEIKNAAISMANEHLERLQNMATEGHFRIPPR